jgi:hypothetical protein
VLLVVGWMAGKVEGSWLVAGLLAVWEKRSSCEFPAIAKRGSNRLVLV